MNEHGSFQEKRGMGNWLWYAAFLFAAMVGATLYFGNSEKAPAQVVTTIPWQHNEVKVFSLTRPESGDRIAMFAVPGCVTHFDAVVVDLDPIDGRVVADIVPVKEPVESGGTAGTWLFLEVYAIYKDVEQVTWKVDVSSAGCVAGISGP